VAEAQRTGEIRAIALANARTRLTTISPPPDHRLAPDDWLIVVATAAGLTRMLAASTVDQKS